MKLEDGIRRLMKRVRSLRAAMKPPKEPLHTTELGAPGTHLIGGLIREDTEAAWNAPFKFQTASKMFDDANLRAIVESYLRPIRGAEWACNPFVAPDMDLPDEQSEMIAAEVQEFLFNMPDTKWKDFIGQAAYGRFVGLALFEMVWYVDGGKWRPRKLGHRLGRQIRDWKTGKNGELLGVHLQTWGDTQTDYILPVKDMLHVVYGFDGGNFEGQGLFRSMYADWKDAVNLKRIYSIAMERSGMGIFVYETDSEIPSEVEDLNKLVKELGVGERVGLVTKTGEQLTVTEIREPRSIQQAIDARYRSCMLTALTEHMDLGGQSATGSWSLSQTQYDQFLSGLYAVAETIRDIVQTRIIDPMVALNYGAETPPPQLSVRIEGKSPMDMAETLKLYTDAGLLTPDEDLEAFIREESNLPPKSESADAEDAAGAAEDDDPSQATESVRVGGGVQARPDARWDII